MKIVNLIANEFLKRTVSLQLNTWSKDLTHKTIEEILNGIQSDHYKKITLNLRKLLKSDPEKYKAEKLKLNAVTFTASFFQSRKIENIDTYNSLIVIDIDKLNKNSILKVYKHLKTDAYVFSFWKSPSGNGFKGLVPINYHFDISKFDLQEVHKYAFSCLKSYFSDAYDIELDVSGNDIPRLCFLSYDSNLIIKEKINNFMIEEDPQADYIKNSRSKQEDDFPPQSLEKVKYLNDTNRNNSLYRQEVISILRFLKRNKTSITNSYDDWYRVAMAIANTFDMEEGLKIFRSFSELDKEKYNSINCDIFLRKCYKTSKNKISFNTIKYLASKKGYR